MIIIDAYASPLEERWAIYDRVAAQEDADGGRKDMDEADKEDLDDHEYFDQIDCQDFHLPILPEIIQLLHCLPPCHCRTRRHCSLRYQT